MSKETDRSLLIFKVSLLIICLQISYVKAQEKPTNNLAITFVVPIDKSKFYEGSTIGIFLTSEQVIKLEQTGAGCWNSLDESSGKYVKECTPGVTSEDFISFERFYSIDKIGESIEFSTTYLKMGENYTLTISGTSRDGCNLTGASYRSSLHSKRVELQLSDFPKGWGSTQMLCHGFFDRYKDKLK